jgi:hypothetical protein
MRATVCSEVQEEPVAHKDTIPLPLAKLARRLAQLPKDKAHRVTLWFEEGEPRWVVELLGTIESKK